MLELLNHGLGFGRFNHQEEFQSTGVPIGMAEQQSSQAEFPRPGARFAAKEAVTPEVPSGRKKDISVKD
jgi:hypothetical protein